MKAIGSQADVLARSIARHLAGASLSEGAKQEVLAWAQKHHADKGASITPLEQVMVTRALKTHEAAFSPDERLVLRDVYEKGYQQLVGVAPAKDTLEPLPTWSRAASDPRVRILQNAVFERQGLFAGYRPTLSDAAVVSAMTAMAVAAPSMTAAALLGGAAASTVEHQVHTHVMHARPEVVRAMNANAESAFVKPLRQFFLIHKGAHHGRTFLDNEVTKWRPGAKERFYASIDNPEFQKFAMATEEGVRLTPPGMAAYAVGGVVAASSLALLGGLALGMSVAVAAPVALAFGLPMALMPMFPHYLHRFSHMSRSEAAKHLDDQRKTGLFGQVKSAVMERIIETRAFQGLARFHNQHHADDKHGVKSNMSMLASADALLGTGKRASFELLVSLWELDAVGFPAAPGRDSGALAESS